mmetsp:Transcript_87/g.264  ORF Transcript_87/g.264 Transcript_87/m.264 type:complete len:142 (+) Transcript_87:1125-1550(+)
MPHVGSSVSNPGFEKSSSARATCFPAFWSINVLWIKLERSAIKQSRTRRWKKRRRCRSLRSISTRCRARFLRTEPRRFRRVELKRLTLRRKPTRRVYHHFQIRRARRVHESNELLCRNGRAIDCEERYHLCQDTPLRILSY